MLFLALALLGSDAPIQPVVQLEERAAAPLRYRLDIKPASPVPVVSVEMRLRGDDDGTTELELPTRWAGSDDLWRNIGGWSVHGGTLTDTDRPELKRIRHRPGTMLTIRYRVRDPDTSPPGPDYRKALPWIERDWITLHGEGIFIIPSGGEDRPARFIWGKVPREWRVASDLDVPPPGLTANQVATGIFIGGRDLRLIERRVDNTPLRLALLGQWDFTDAQLADHIGAVIATENAMLGAPAIPFLVTLTPLANPNSNRVSFGGTGRTAGFALTGTRNLPFRDLPRLLGHEYAHRWFAASRAAPDTYWLTEGFNDWFSAQAMLGTGDWDVARWVKEFNAVLKRHATSAAFALTPQQRFDRFWTDQAAEQFPYDDGQLSATILDARLRAAGRQGLLPILVLVNRTGGLGDRAAVEAAIDAALPGSVAQTKALMTREGLARLPVDLFPCGKIENMAGVPQFVPAPGPCPALAGAASTP